MNRLLVICGPTATGKTSLGISLAKKFNGEIISADSRQVYRGMDIGTGKDLDKFTIYNLQFTIDDLKIGYCEVEGIKIWLLDIVRPDYKFNVADYKKCAEAAIENILKRGRLPIIVGGTGFYIKTLLEGIGTMGIGPDWELRDQLSHHSSASLLDTLEKLDPERSRRMNESDRSNPRRLVRAIEVATKLKTKNLKLKTKNLKLDYLLIGLTAPNEILYKRIDQRVDERIKSGAEEEIKKLLKKGYNWENSVMGQTIGYREWREYFEGKATREEVIQKWKFAEHEYARKQLTWFNKEDNISWYSLESDNWKESVEKNIKDWYS